jgi:hypothetical protein
MISTSVTSTSGLLPVNGFNGNHTYLAGGAYLFEGTVSATTGNFCYFEGGGLYPATQTITSAANSITTANYYLSGDGSWQPLTFSFSGNWEAENNLALPAQSTILAGQAWTDWNEVYRPPLPQIVSAARVPDWQEKEKERMGKQAKARETARRSLLSLLDRGQKESLEKEHAFELRVEDRLYRIRPGNTVEQLHPETRKALCSFCIHPYGSEWLPEDDWAIAQKLLLEADEDEFLRLANRRAYA